MWPFTVALCADVGVVSGSGGTSTDEVTSSARNKDVGSL